MGKRAEQHEYRRRQLLQIALEQFIVKGFYGTSTREIARLAGISSGLLFNYFATKEQLFEALVEIGCSQMILMEEPSAKTAVENDPGNATDRVSNDRSQHAVGLEPLTVFGKRLGELLQLLRDQPYAARIFVFMGYASRNAALISPKAGALLEQHDVIRQSVPLILEGQKQGAIRQGDPLGLSAAFWCAIQGFAEEFAHHPGTPLPEPEWILDILRAKKGGTE